MNLFIATGNIGRDCELRHTPNGKSIASFPLPVTSGWGENQKTSWVECKLFGDRAERLTPYLLKGGKVMVQGSFVLEEWEKDGVKHSKPVIIVNEVELPPKQAGQQQAQPQQATNYQQAQANYAQQQSQPSTGFDDIPF